MNSLQCHASCVALNGRGVLIRGASGTGKSSLALRLMSMGCDLVADDQTLITNKDGILVASCPEQIQNKIEARGVGILNASAVENAVLVLVIDLDKIETDRLPPHRTEDILNLSLPVCHKSESGYFPDAILQYLKAGRHA